jgi:metal-responsive CopG/Arc/MetJ family transcriptional regulator
MDLPRNTETITISVPSWLIQAVDEYCSCHDFSRSRLISRAVRKYLLQEIDTPELWNQLYAKRFSEY